MTERSTSKMFDTSLRVSAPGPGGPPLLNNVRFMRDPLWYTLDRLLPAARGPVMPVTGGNGSVVVVRGQPAVRQVFTDNDTFHRLADGVFRLPPGHPWSGMFDAVITANGAAHRRARRLLLPVVHRSAMEHYRTVFEETFARSRLARAGDGEPFDLVAELLTLTKINMLVCLLGLPATEADLRLAELIERRRAGPPAPDALSIIAHTTDEDGDSLTTPEIVGELHGFFAAGFETTAMTMTWALVAALADPELRAELFGTADAALIDALVKESQRLVPAVPLSLPRRVVRDVEVSGVAVPRGALLFAAPVLEHRDPELYPDPEVFRPRRWLAEDFQPSPFEFLPYGVGARRCLGASFADLQVRVTLGLLFGSVPELELATARIDYRIRHGATGFPTGPIMVRPASGAAPVRLEGTVTRLLGQGFHQGRRHRSRV